MPRNDGDIRNKVSFRSPVNMTLIQLLEGWEGQWQTVGTRPGLHPTHQSTAARAHGWAEGLVQGEQGLLPACLCTSSSL